MASLCGLCMTHASFPPTARVISVEIQHGLGTIGKREVISSVEFTSATVFGSMRSTTIRKYEGYFFPGRALLKLIISKHLCMRRSHESRRDGTVSRRLPPPRIRYLLGDDCCQHESDSTRCPEPFRSGNVHHGVSSLLPGKVDDR